MGHPRTLSVPFIVFDPEVHTLSHSLILYCYYLVTVVQFEGTECENCICRIEISDSRCRRLTFPLFLNSIYGSRLTECDCNI